MRLQPFLTKIKKQRGKIPLWFRQFFKFGLVGCLNTGITYGVFILLFRVLRVNEYLANTAGYMAGLINSFLWNKLWTFRSRSFNLRELILFAAVFAVSFGIQMALFHLLIRAGLREEIAELPAMVCYTLVNFAGNKFLTFRPYKKKEATDTSSSADQS